MTEAHPKPHKMNSTRLIVRITVGSVLAILLVLALIDRNAKTSASNTTTTWLKELDAATEDNRDLLHSELSPFVVGSPEITGEPSAGRVVYAWNGIFRSYRTTVTCVGDRIPVVERVEGPES